MKPIMSKSTDLMLRRRTQASLRSLRKLGCAAVSKHRGTRDGARGRDSNFKIAALVKG
jgi:hypothetical protein